MTREIKFRAWDIHHKEMYEVKGMKRTPIGTWEVWDGETAILPCNIILMEYTGLHDKNGKEIYEGDLLKGECQWPSNPLVVTWNDSYARWCLWLEQGAGCIYMLARDRFALGEECFAVKCEVIGNIYQNPELLEAK